MYIMNLRYVHILKSLKQELDQEKAYLKCKKTGTLFVMFAAQYN